MPPPPPDAQEGDTQPNEIEPAPDQDELDPNFHNLPTKIIRYKPE